MEFQTTKDAGQDENNFDESLLGVNGAADEIEKVTLFEWQTQRVQISDLLARRLSKAQFRQWLTISPDPEPGWWTLTAKQFVGGFTVDDLKVIVRPKIDPKNLFLLLEVGLPQEAWLPEAMAYEQTHDLLSSLISFYARTAETTLARGLYHSYRHHEENLMALKGKIEFAQQFRRVGMLTPMSCSFDDFTANVLENRYLKAAIARSLLVAGVPRQDRCRLRRLLLLLEDVDSEAVQADDFNNITVTRLNEHYLPALRLARLILANHTLLDQHGDTSASAFMLDMNKLFERFVTIRLQRELSGRVEVLPQAANSLDYANLVRLYPDILFRQKGEPIGVADIKYKLDENEGQLLASNADYYQLFAYTTAFDVGEGTLIYCVDASTRRSDHNTSIRIRNTNKRLNVVGIDLSGSPNEINAQMTSLANLLANHHLNRL